jgi:teichuronic acid biosynthesis glycosyltransferase TuaC
MKILYVTNMFPNKRNMNFGIFIKEQIDYYAKIHAPEYEVYFVDGKKSKLNYIKSIFNVNKLIRKNNYDLVHIHFGLSGIFLLFNPFIKTPVIVTLHGSDIQSYNKEGLTQKISKKVVSRSDKAIILNDNMINILKDYKDKLIKIPCGIDLSLFNLDRNNINNESFVIGFPSSRNREVKNYPFFAKVIENLENQGYPIKVVEFDNFTRKEVVENLSKLDCLLMTSFSEGSPQIIKEALACNVPIVSINVGDIELLLNNVNNCYVINSFDIQLFADKIKNIINIAPNQRKTNGKDMVKQLGFDQDTIISKLDLLYKDILQ